MNIYVGNLSFEVTSEDLQEIFSEKGEVKSARVITDYESGRSKGFGFVEMHTKADGIKAVSTLNGTEFKGREITVNEARPRNNDHGGGGYRR